MPRSIVDDDLLQLLRLMVANNYTEAIYVNYSQEIENINDTCKEFVAEDYDINTIENNDGRMCAHYPPTIIIQRRVNADISPNELSQWINQTKFARCRSRFVVPAFMFNGKFVCRSSTLSSSVEYHGRQLANFAGLSFDGQYSSQAQMEELSTTTDNTARSNLSQLRDDDCKLLKRLSVKYICDFMLENRKIKCWIPISSSEKADRHGRYKDFHVLPLPYPGSEFFKIWRDSNYSMHELYFDWDQPSIDAKVDPLLIPKTSLSFDIKWNQYKSWDLFTITVNYLKLILGLIYEGFGGLLLHCISGWDRTPLFICLLRCLLWSDDLIHSSLSPIEMLYLTLGYDWFLFGHQLSTRMELGEEIMRFAFQFLSEMADFTSLSLRGIYDISVYANNTDTETKDNRSFVDLRSKEEMHCIRRERLQQLSKLFFVNWDKIMHEWVALSQRSDEAVHHGSNEGIGRVMSKTDKCGSSHTSLVCTNSDDPNKHSLLSQISNAVSSAASIVTSRLIKPHQSEQNP